MALTPNAILRISEPVEQMYMDCTSQLIINLSRHLGTDKNLPTAEWETKKLSELGALTDESIEIIAANTGKTPDAIKKAVTEGMGLEIQETEKVLQGAAAKGRIQSAAMSWDASEGVKTVVNNLVEQATEDTNIVNTVMLNSTRERYAQAVQFAATEEAALIEKLQSATNAVGLEAQLAKTQTVLNASTMSVAVGAEARTAAVRRAITQLAEEGITGYIDKAGHHWTPEAYINMDIRTTVHNAAIKGQEARSADYGVTTFQISSHAGARPLCAPYQGKIYSWDGSSGTVEDLNGNKYSYVGIGETSYGQAAGIFGINCGHRPVTFVDGYSIPRFEPTEDADKNAEEYRISQEQRYLERQIRNEKTKALSYNAAGDKEAFAKSAQKIKDKQAEYKAFCDKNDRTPRNDRTQVTGYNRQMASKANAAAKSYEKPAVAKPTTTKPAVAGKYLASSATGDYGDTINKLYENGNATVKAVWEKALPTGGCVEDYNYKDTPYQSYGKVYLNAEADLNNKRGAGVTYFHEHGHAIDYEYGYISSDEEFKKALKADYNAAKKATGAKNAADQQFNLSVELYGKPDYYNGVSDIMGGLSGNKAKGAWGHSTTYWRRDSEMINKEAFAHMTEAAFCEDQRKAIEEYFPTAYDRYLELMKGLL